MYRFPVISDSHVGDCLPGLPLLLLETLSRGKYDFICHAGDITTERVLSQLNEIAPTIAVKGDNDHHIKGLRRFEKIVANGKTIILTHGDRTRERENPSKIVNMALGRLGIAARWWNGYTHDICNSFVSECPHLILCGHLHKPFVKHYKGTLMVNPGAVYVTGQGVQRGFLPSFAILTIGKSISVEFVYLVTVNHLLPIKPKVATSYV